MSFIGIVSESKCFDAIKERLKELDCSNKITVIHITNKSIENMKNVRFDVIVINSGLEKLKDYQNSLEKICSHAEYLLLNTDINKSFSLFENEKTNLITYGLNRDSTVTISSISETDILIYIQRNIKNKENKLLEIEEKRIKLKKPSKCKTYEIMIIYTILALYCQDIIDEI